MKRIYKNKGKLRFVINTKCDLTGYDTVYLCYKKPDDSQGKFTAYVSDVKNGTIIYDVKNDTEIDESGWWKFWPEIVFDDERTACGRAAKVFVYKCGN